MTRRHLRIAPLLFCALVASGCGEDDSEPAAGASGAATAGSSGSGGKNSQAGQAGTSGKGGSAQGGSAGSSQGGAAQGGSSQGGSSQGGASQGGAAQGGSAQGGAAQGGSAQGGAAQGGAAQGGTGGSQAGGQGGSGAGAGGSGDNLPPAGNPEGACAVPAEAQPEDTSAPTTVVGKGTAASCTSAEFVAAVAKGGIITFDCGPDPVTITVEQTAKIFNNTGPKIVIDGGNKVTLSGAGQRRILYQNTCDQAQVWTTDHCQDQDHPQLTVQNLTFIEGNAKGEDPDGGGAIFVRGGRFKVINSRFFNNTCDDVGPDVGGGAIRTLSQHNGQPVYVVKSTFGGKDGLGNVCSNGAGLSSIGVSYTVINSLFSHNSAIGNGANPAKPGTPGGGSGGAIYNDGNTFTLSLCGVSMAENTANEGGGAIFFVSNNKTGSLYIKDSKLHHNVSKGFETQGYPGIFVIAKEPPIIENSTLD